jgi:t-SNARE complex subunit (syntaxin)
VEIEDATDATKANVEGALTEVTQANTRRGYCQCTKTKLLCWGLLVLIALVIVLALVMSLK